MRPAPVLYVVESAAGEFLCLPEGRRRGSEGEVRPPPAEWGSLDHAARFPSREAAERTRAGRVVAVAEVWGRDD